VKVSGLTVTYGEKVAVQDVSFEVRSGSKVAIVGESGSGKTTIVNTILGVLPPTARVRYGHVDLEGESPSYVGQDPNTNLNPVLRIKSQIGDLTSRENAVELLKLVELEPVDRVLESHPHVLSGGMKQRVLIALALAKNPTLLVADEPTSALDVKTGNRILELLNFLVSEKSLSLLFITHDIALALREADHIVIMKDGVIVEQGSAQGILNSPKHSYTKLLLEYAAEVKEPQSAVDYEAVAYEVQNLSKSFDSKETGASKGKRNVVIDGLNIKIKKGLTTAIVGPSGSGKTTFVNMLMGLESPTSGVIKFEGVPLKLLQEHRLTRDELAHKVSAVFQNPYSSLDPRKTVFKLLEEPMLIHKKRLTRYRDAKFRELRVREVLALVGLDASLLRRNPVALSGGQRQRVAIARALTLEPEVLFFDEAVSALDVVASSGIVTLIRDLQHRLGLTCVFITHDARIANNVAHETIHLEKVAVHNSASN
jgi:peptide/nickel transport system ATP-binding protein